MIKHFFWNRGIPYVLRSLLDQLPYMKAKHIIVIVNKARLSSTLSKEHHRDRGIGWGCHSQIADMSGIWMKKVFWMPNVHAFKCHSKTRQSRWYLVKNHWKPERFGNHLNLFCGSIFGALFWQLSENFFRYRMIYANPVILGGFVC